MIVAITTPGGIAVDQQIDGHFFVEVLRNCDSNAIPATPRLGKRHLEIYGGKP
jgi:hypothetical protein